MAVLIELFFSFFRIGLLSIGGGYASIPLIQSRVVDLHGWLTIAEFAYITTIAEMTPGPIVINAATFVGIRVAGVPGAIVATLGCIVPSCAIVLTLAYIYYRFRDLKAVQGVLAGVRPVAAASIASAGITLLILAVTGGRTLPKQLSAVDPVQTALAAAAFFVLRKFKPGPMRVIAGTGAAALVIGMLAKL